MQLRYLFYIAWFCRVLAKSVEGLADLLDPEKPDINEPINSIPELIQNSTPSDASAASEG